MCASVIGTIKKESPEKFVTRHWRGDEAAKLHARGVTAPASTTGWAADLTGSAVVTSPLTWAPASVAAKLSQRCVSLEFSRADQVLSPTVDTPPTGTWVAEGNPASMVQTIFGMTKVGPPKKILFGAAVSNEIATYSPDVAVPMIRLAVTNAANLSIDTALLDATAADSLRPAGLLADVSDLGATAGGGSVAMLTDLAAIAGAMADAKIEAEDLIIIANPRQSIVLRGMLTGPAFRTYTIIGTPAVAAGTVIGLAPAAIATYFAAPELEISPNGLVHMEDTSPRDIDTTAVSQTVVSAFQAGLLLLKLRLRCTWAPLAAAAVQKIESVTW